jgi:hypothetical protein
MNMWEMLSSADIDVDRVIAGPDDAWEAVSSGGRERITWTYDTAGEFPGWSWTAYRADGGADAWVSTDSYEGPDDDDTRESLLDAVRAVAGAGGS